MCKGAAVYIIHSMLSLGPLYYEVGEKQEHFFVKKNKQKLLQVCAGFLHFQPAIQKLSPFIIMWWLLFPLNGLLSHKHQQATGNDVLTLFKIRYPVSWKPFLFRWTHFFHNAALIGIHHSLLLTKQSRKEFINSIQSLAAVIIDYCLVYVKCLLFAMYYSLYANLSTQQVGTDFS